jgi:hypothetical protein
MAESDVAAPVSEEKKRRGGIGAVLDRKDEEIARLKAELEEERAAKAATAQPITTGSTEPIPVNEAATAPATPPSPVSQGYDPYKDPLGWIAVKDIERVALVSTDTHLVLSPIVRMHGVPRTEYGPTVRCSSSGEWPYCPFEFRGSSDTETREMKLRNKEFHHFHIDTYMAQDVWSKKRTPEVPKDAIVAVSDYKGIHPTGRWPLGKKSPSSGHGLTEVIRFLLQNNPGRVWIHYGTHEEACCQWIHWKKPNPYTSEYAMTGGSPLRVDEAVSHVTAGRTLYGGA